MVLKPLKKYGFPALCLAILCVYFVAACTINFSGRPGFYSTDMYTDMVYAQEAWEHKSIFPEGWVFGNQLYAVATPVLAALFYGICSDQVVAMALASTVMGVLTLVSFGFLIKAMFPGIRLVLLGCAFFAGLTLSFGGAVREVNGWQLFFTMCSFYACYAISAFLAFGCYIRSVKRRPKDQWLALVFACFMAFGTGVQSLRQTLIMTCPLVAVEGLWFLLRLWKKRPLLTNTTITCLLIAICNIAGVLFAEVANIPQVEIFGKLQWLPLANGLKNLQASAQNALSLFGVQDKLLAVVLLSCGGGGLLCLAWKLWKKGSRAGALSLCLLGVSVAAILALDCLTTMSVRNIYYFLLYPLVALAAVAAFFLGGRSIKCWIGALLILFAAHGTQTQLPEVLEQARNPVQYAETVAYLKENGITTVFSGWNRGERIAIASKGAIKAAFWDYYKTPFVAVMYLCDPAGFDAAPESCAYLFFSPTEAEVAVSKAWERGVELKLQKHIVTDGIYIYTADVNLMTKK